MAPALQSVQGPREHALVDQRVVMVSGVAILIAVAAALVAEGLTHLIGFITNISYYGRLSFEIVAPTLEYFGAWTILIPIAGALIVGVMARYGSTAIRGHGIPEVMDNVLHARSRIAPRLMFLKPLSSAVAIGTGGPFGAEGPIIATGGAMGSLGGQLLRVTADERKTLLAAGAAAGMSATFGSPVSAVLLAIELLLFEFRPRSAVPVALAAATAAGVRALLVGSEPVFAMANIATPGPAALASYTVLGLLIGVAAVGVTRAVYLVEDGFERVPFHWMWWPAIGAVVVGAVGYIEPRTLGVGYYNIENILTGSMLWPGILTLVILKFVAWAVYLGSGTSGGTLAPLFTIGGGLGAVLGVGAAAWLPGLGVDPHVAALVGMAAIFAGASHTLLTSVVFAFETTRQPIGLLPLLAGCSAAYLVSLLMMRNSIMTEKLARRGASVLTEYAVDHLTRVLVRDAASREVVSLNAEDAVTEVRERLATVAGHHTHQGFPVLEESGDLIGVVTRRDLMAAATARTVREAIKRPPAVAFEDSTLREAADHMVREGVGRLPVVTRETPNRVTGIISRSDLLAAHQQRLRAAHRVEHSIAPLLRRRVRR